LRRGEIRAGQGELPQIALALHPAGGLAGRLDDREQEADQDRQDRDYDEQFHERETM
jgi:hypothetical protein